MPPSRVGTVDLLKSRTHVFVDENLKPVSPGSTEAAFTFKRSDLDRVQSRRAELGITDEAARVQTASHKVALADAKRRAAAAAADVEVLEARVAASDKAEKAAAKANAGDKAEKAE